MKWLFVGGPPRSGTTLVQHILNLFPDVKILRETNFGSGLQEILTFNPEDDNNCILKHTGLTELFKYDIPDIDQCCYDIACEIRNWFGNPLWFGDKQPMYAAYRRWGIIDKVFKNDEVKWIMTTRDIRDNLKSIKEYLNLDIQISLPLIERCNKEAKKLCENHDVLYINHYDLQNNPDICIMKMAHFININLDNITYNKAIDLVINGNINRCISKDKNKHYRYWVKD